MLAVGIYGIAQNGVAIAVFIAAGNRADIGIVATTIIANLHMSTIRFPSLSSGCSGQLKWMLQRPLAKERSLIR